VKRSGADIPFAPVNALVIIQPELEEVLDCSYRKRLLGYLRRKKVVRLFGWKYS
jgi:hypothetical protein